MSSNMDQWPLARFDPAQIASILQNASKLMQRKVDLANTDGTCALLSVGQGLRQREAPPSLPSRIWRERLWLLLLAQTSRQLRNCLPPSVFRDHQLASGQLNVGTFRIAHQREPSAAFRRCQLHRRPTVLIDQPQYRRFRIRVRLIG